MIRHIVLLATTILGSVVASGFNPYSDDDALRERWVNSVYNSLSERQRVAQLFFPRFDLTDNAQGLATIAKTVRNEGIGGFLLGKGTLTSYYELIRAARLAAKVPPMVTLDGEWGLAMRVSDAPRYPYNAALGTIADTALLGDYGREVGRQCRLLGITVNFAPVLDVNSNPANPVIGRRSFGDDPERVGLLGLAYARGLQQAGVMAVGKHFPGHGDTSTDSHKTLPRVDRSRSGLDEIELPPFRTFISGGGRGMMVGHLNVPALDASGTPASLSQAITTGLLRDELGFDGLVFTDALAMRGADGDGRNICIQALLAGADVLLQSRSLHNDIEAVLAASRDGTLPQGLIENRCRRLLRAKYDALQGPAPAPDAARARNAILNDGDKTLNERLTTAPRYTPSASTAKADPPAATTARPAADRSLWRLSASLPSKIDAIVRKGLAEGAFTACQVVVIHRDSTIINRAWGTTAKTSGVKVTRESLFDIASMTKATGTLAGIMKAYDEGLFRLDDRIETFIPDMAGTEQGSLTVRSLLLHESGMPAVINTYRLMADPASYDGSLTSGRRRAPYTIRLDRNLYAHSGARIRRDITSPQPTDDMPFEAAAGIYVGQNAMDTVRHVIHNTPLRGRGRYRYSCLNFCLLMEMEENLTGYDHKDWVEEHIFEPLAMNNTGYRPAEWAETRDIVSTERDDFMRRQTLKGFVHDEIAAWSGGVQGNAGLFSNATELSRLCSMYLHEGMYNGRQIISPETIRLFTQTVSSISRRGLGFDRTTVDGEFTPDGHPVQLYGHTGFTGTCFWIDPQTETIYIFLSNRIHPSRNNAAFARLHPRETILQEIYRSFH